MIELYLALDLPLYMVDRRKLELEFPFPSYISTHISLVLYRDISISFSDFFATIYALVLLIIGEVDEFPGSEDMNGDKFGDWVEKVSRLKGSNN